MKHLSGATLLALPTNIRLGWKGLPGTNTPAFYKNLQIMAVKSFTVQAPDVNLAPVWRVDFGPIAQNFKCKNLFY